MKWILPLNEPVKNLKEYASIYGDELAGSGSESESKGDLAHTEQDQMRDAGLGQLHRFQKKAGRGWQISFQKYFLAQHTATFKKQLQNFLEFARPDPNLENPQPRPPPSDHSQQVGEPPTLAALLAEARIPASALHLHQFSLGRAELADLEGFLNEVLGQCSPALGRELAALTVDLWIQFREIDFKFLERKELLEKAEEWVAGHGRCLCQREDLPCLNWQPTAGGHQKGQFEIPKGLARFLRYFSTTLLFILAGYFQNPYTGGNCEPQRECGVDYPKRQLAFFGAEFWSNQSDFSDQEDSFQAKKIRKQS